MKLIHFRGLHCYHDCIITLAGMWGLDYEYAFSRLWAEGDLRLEPICRTFLTRTMPELLASLGMELDAPCTDPSSKEQSWKTAADGAFFLVGMDGFQIPWTPIFRLLHGPHYFIAQKADDGGHVCFDPTYGVQGMRQQEDTLIHDSYALIPVRRTRAAEPSKGHGADFAGGESISALARQAREVLTAHPETLRRFLIQAEKWLRGTEETALLPAKYTDALISHRWLYRHFLESRRTDPAWGFLFYDRQYHEQWQAVKNGCYKAALTKDPAVFEEIRRLLSDLFQREMLMAGGIVEKSDNVKTPPIFRGLWG